MRKLQLNAVTYLNGDKNVDFNFVYEWFLFVL